MTGVNVLVAHRIMEALEEIPAGDRSGFLFALSVGPMLAAGWSKEKFTEEVMKALDIAWTNRQLTMGKVKG